MHPSPRSQTRLTAAGEICLPLFLCRRSAQRIKQTAWEIPSASYSSFLSALIAYRLCSAFSVSPRRWQSGGRHHPGKTEKPRSQTRLTAAGEICLPLFLCRRSAQRI